MQLPLLAHLAGMSMAFPVVGGLARLKSLDASLKLILALTFINFAAVAFQLYLNLKGSNNLWVSHFYNIVEFSVLMLVFSEWQNNGKLKTFFRGLAGLYGLFWLGCKVFIEPLDQQAYFSSITSKILFTTAAIYLLHKMSGEITIRITREPRFWILSSVLISDSGSLLFYALRSVIDRLPLEGLTIAYSMHWSIIVLANILMAIGFLCKPPVQRSGGQLELAP